MFVPAAVRRLEVQGTSKQLPNRLDSAIHQRYWAALRPGKFSREIDSQSSIDGRSDFAWSSRARSRRRGDFVALANHLPALQRTAAHQHGPALRPMIAAARGINFWSAPELASGDDHGVREQPPLGQLFEQRAVRHVEHWPHQIAITTDGAEGARAVNIPGDLVEHGFEHVDGNETPAGFDQ